MTRIGLRLFLYVTVCASLVIVGLFGFFVWQTSNRMREIAISMQNDVESVSTAQTVRASLDRHRRQALLADITKSWERDQVRASERDRLITAGRRIEQLSTSKEESVAARRLSAAIATYLDETDRLHDVGVHGQDLWKSMSSRFEVVVAELHDVIEVNTEQALNMEREAISEGTSLKSWSIALFSSILLIALAFLFIFRRYIYVPLLRLRRAIGEFADRSRLPEPYPLALAEIREISETFHSLGERLLQQKEDRLLFMSSVAHDLRNPLGAIEMSIDLMNSDNNAAEDQAERRELVVIMRRQIQQLKRLVEDILEGTRVEAGRFTLQKSLRDVREIVSDAVRIFQSLSAAHSIRLDLPEKRVAIECDPQRLGQVIDNLLSNAIKYSPSGGEINVSIRELTDEVRVSVKDSGVGIAVEDLGRIFQPFRRAKATRQDIPGYGIGLTTAKKIVEAHDGKIEVSSRMGRGSTFVVCLPSSGKITAQESIVAQTQLTVQ